MSRLVVYSNRIPLGQAASGGLVVALEKTMENRGGVWIGTRLDDTVTRHQLQAYAGGKFDRHALHLPADEYNKYYLGYSNSVLWPLFHGRTDLLDVAEGQLAAYASVNRKLAEATKHLIKPSDTVWIHDYHFIPLASELRKLGIRNPIGFFLHTPFPSSSHIQALTHRDRLLAWLSAYDLVGLQTQRDVSAMIEVCRTIFSGQMLPDGRIRCECLDIWPASFPIGIDARQFRDTAISHQVPASKIAPGQKLLIGVDRLDYSKGLPHKFRGFRRYLHEAGETTARSTLLQIASPTRESVEAYQDIRRDLERLTGEVNGEFGQLGYVPIQYIHKSIPRHDIAGLYRRADIALVTPLVDGMNLVAKEFVAAQDEEDPGVLILSEAAGAAEQLKIGALMVNPYDPGSISNAIEQAVGMSREERVRRHQAQWNEIARRDVHWWTRTFLDNLKRNAEMRRDQEEALLGVSAISRP